MKKIIYTRYGSIDDLQMADVPTPTLKDDEILIRVKAVAINPIDWKRLEGQLKIMTGSSFPKGIGIDFSGVVENKGEAVARFQPGDAVLGGLDAMNGEALAEAIVVKESAIVRKPDAVSFETAAAAVTTSVTALHLLETCNCRSGDHILIQGASGGVGMAVLQMAKQRGIRVTAVASGAGLAFIRKWNPDAVIDYKTHNVLDQPDLYNAIIELSGHLPFNQAKALLKPQAVFASTLPNPVDMLKATVNNLFSSKKFRIIMAKPTPEHLRHTCEWLTQHGLEVPIAHPFALAAFKEAYRLARKGGIVGKVVISV